MELIIVKGSNFYIKASSVKELKEFYNKNRDRIHIDAYKDKQGYEWVSNNFS